MSRPWSLWLLVGFAAVSCARTRHAEPEAKHDAAVSVDAGLSESRVPDSGVVVIVDAGKPAPARPAYRITGSLSVQPDTSARGYVLHEQRLEMLQVRCSKVADQTLCVSGSLHGLR